MISSRTQHLLAFQILKMASRRSSRLSVVSGSDLAKLPSTTGPPATGKKRKAVDPGKTENLDKDGFAVPATPKRKKATKTAPPSTPTPAAAKLMGAPSGTADSDDGMPPKNRAADPHTTNAPLVSPETSRVIASKATDAVSPSKAPQSKTTTGNILEKACAHLIKTDPRLKPLIEKHHCSIFSAQGLAQEIDPFKALSSGIISQQVGCDS
jgi:DNA-3-methyladenine glycosylase II